MMKRVGQSAIEYMFMLAAVLIMVLFVAKIIIHTMKTLNDAVSTYIESVRKQVLENI